MTDIFFATGNKGKQKEISNLAVDYADALQLKFPTADMKVDIEENGATFEQNALKKAEAYESLVGSSMVVVGDDSGLIIPALNNEPGVYTRRWAGYEMSDQELIDYCLEKMHDLHGEERQAIFETVLVAIFPDKAPKVYRGQMFGRIVKEQMGDEVQEGFPFRSLFWVDGLDVLLNDFDRLTTAERDGFLTHREAAFTALFDDIAEE